MARGLLFLDSEQRGQRRPRGGLPEEDPMEYLILIGILLPVAALFSLANQRLDAENRE
jgi:hypothetical protein